MTNIPKDKVDTFRKVYLIDSDGNDISDSNPVPISSGDGGFGMQIENGDRTDLKAIFISATNETIATGTPQLLASRGGTYVFPTTASQWNVVSTNANDTLLGTSARQVIIDGLDDQYETLIEIVDLNGTNPVTTTNSFFRVNGFQIVAAGSNKINAGTITLSNGANVMSQIDIAEGQSRQAVGTVPANRTWLSQGVFASVAKGDEVTFFGQAFSPLGFSLVFSKNFMYQNIFDFKNFTWFPFPEKFDFALTAKRTSTGQNAKMQIIIQFLEKDNS